ncbi:hypothetical protein ACVCAH_26725 [Micromonospora sp. LZ34]
MTGRDRRQARGAGRSAASEHMAGVAGLASAVAGLIAAVAGLLTAVGATAGGR